MANLPANPGEALWIGTAGGQNHANVGIGQGTSNTPNDHTDYPQSDIVDNLVNEPNKFFLNSDGNIVFRINASAGTTSTNTKHPRSECREMQQNGTSVAKWDGRTGTHYLKARCRIITVTSNRPWICFGQIHGSSTSPNTSDLIRLQTEGTNGTSTNLSLVARRTPPGGSEIRTVLRTGYNVGDWFSYEIRSVNGTITVYLDDVLVLTASGMGQIDDYFKWGCYLQDSLGEGATSSDWGAVEFERGSVQVWHTGTPTPTTPVFTGATDPNGGAGGGSGNDTQAPSVPGSPLGVRGNNQAALSWSASADNVGVTGYRVYRFSASGSTGGSGSSTTLGSQVNGAGTTSSSSDKMAASSATATAGGTLTSGHFRAWLDASGSTTAKMVVYADSSGAPGARLATSDQLTITSTTADTVRDFVFSGAAQITITAGTTYWVAVHWADPGTPNLVYSRDGLTAGRVESTAAYGTPPNPFGTISGTFTGPIDAWVDVVAGTGAGTGGGGTITTLGKTTDGASSSASSADKTAVSTFTAASSGTLVAGHARVWLSGAGSATVKCVVYANSSGAPGARLATSNAITVTNTTETLKDFTFSGADQIAITSGTTYWIGVAWADPGTVSLTVSRDGTASGRQETSSYAPSTFGTPTALTGPIDVYVDVSSASGSSAGGFALLTTRTSGQLSYTDTGLTNGVEYQYRISAVDAAGNESAQTDTITVIPGPPDTTAPTVPTGLTATAGDRRVTLSWTASTDTDSGMYRYGIYRGGVYLDAVDSPTTSYTDVNVANGTSYSYQVYAIDRSLNASALSSAASATPTAPAIGGVGLLPAALSSAKVEVAIAFGADPSTSSAGWTWTDVTTDVRYDPGISTSLGRNDEAGTSNPATLTLDLDNTSGAYSLGAGSSHYPYVRRNVPVRVRIDPGSGGGRVVFLGYADGFTPKWPVLTGEIPIVTLSASGALRRLAQGTAPIQSTYRRVMSTTSSVVAYWPLEEGASARYAPAAVGGSTADMTLTGRPDWQSDSDFDCSAPLPRLKDGKFVATVPSYTDTGSSQVRLLLHLSDSGVADGTILLRVTATGTIAQWDLAYVVASNGPSLKLTAYASGGTTVVHEDLVLFDLLDEPGRFSLEWTTTGTTVVREYSFRKLSDPTNATFSRKTITGRTGGRVSGITLNPLGANIDVTMGHVTVESTVTNTFSATEALVAQAGEYAIAFPNGRLARLCTENRVPLTQYGTGATLGVLDQMGPQLVAPLLTLLREVELAEQGQLWDGRNAGLSYTSRRYRGLNTARLTIDASDGQLGPGFAPVDDDQRDRNRMTVTRLHGVTVTYEDAAGVRGTGAIGIYDDSATINTYSDDYVAQYARWFVALGTQVGYRYPTVTVDLAASSELAAAVLDVIPGMRIDVVNIDSVLAGLTGDAALLLVEGIAHEINTREWKVTFRCSPWAPWQSGLDGA